MITESPRQLPRWRLYVALLKNVKVRALQITVNSAKSDKRETLPSTLSPIKKKRSGLLQCRRYGNVQGNLCCAMQNHDFTSEWTKITSSWPSISLSPLGEPGPITLLPGSVARESHVGIPCFLSVSKRDSYLSVIAIGAWWDCGFWQRVMSVGISSFGSILNDPLLHTSLNVGDFVSSVERWIFKAWTDSVAELPDPPSHPSSLSPLRFHSTLFWRKLAQHSRNISSQTSSRFSSRSLTVLPLQARRARLL